MKLSRNNHDIDYSETRFRPFKSSYKEEDVKQWTNKFSQICNNENHSKRFQENKRDAKNRKEIHNTVRKVLTDILFKKELTEIESQLDMEKQNMETNRKKSLSYSNKSIIKDKTNENEINFIIPSHSSSIKSDYSIIIDEEEDKYGFPKEFQKVIQVENVNLDVEAKKKKGHRKVSKKPKTRPFFTRKKASKKKKIRKDEAVVNFGTSHDETKLMPSYAEDKRNCVSITIEEDPVNVNIKSVQVSVPESHKLKGPVTKTKSRHIQPKRVESNIEISTSGGSVGIAVKRVVKNDKVKKKAEKPYIVVQAPIAEEDADEDERNNRCKDPINDNLCDLEQGMIDTILVGIGEKKDFLKHFY
ncbi:uncharacterized protein LOC111622511 [Centruroides sculpturatus]|uniref:uncharacterized protein LOC111622511 n=1 Tax=Centruroides sculpturatus TaxID=218467 RepID=UPI000C6E06CC|nr:uncharacterized protein LOC111622511 [Centruroides sculpturatus]